ncbi:hypothetical protein PS947_05616 [Pseudomonas fluorescens]|nr:hypothetical protein PS947_05616 [Pseudomonas fluorescens]
MEVLTHNTFLQKLFESEIVICLQKHNTGTSQPPRTIMYMQ